jgi:PAS domain S-box-containing protein
MTLQKKVLFMILVTVASLLFLTVAISSILMSRSFSKLEHDSVDENLQRISNAIESKVAVLDTLAIDWATWDETYNFAADGNEPYIQNNLNDTTFRYLDANLIAVIDQNGRIIKAKAFSLADDVEVPVSAELITYLDEGTIFPQEGIDSGMNAILSLANGPMIVVARPILTSLGEGPEHGRLVLGRYLDQALLAGLGETTLIEATAYSLTANNIPEDVAKFIPELVDNTRLVKPLDQNNIAGYQLLRNVENEPYLVIKIDMPRPIAAQARQFTMITIVMITLVFILFLVVNLVFFRKTVLSRLRNLSRAVVDIGESNDTTMRVPVDGQDELGVLGREINATLTKLFASEKALRESENKYSALVEQSNDGILTINDNLIEYTNPRLCEMMGMEAADLVGRPFLNIVADEDKEKAAGNYRARMSGRAGISRYELNLVHKNSRRIPVEAHATIIEINGEKRDMAVIHDMRQWKDAEHQIKEQKRLIDRIIDNNPGALLVMGRNRRISLVNRALVSIFKLGTRPLEGRSIIEIIPDEAILQMVTTCFETGQASGDTEVTINIAGETSTLVVNIVPMEDDEALLTINRVAGERDKVPLELNTNG